MRQTSSRSSPSDQQLADFARGPMQLVALQRDDQALDFMRQLVGKRTGRSERSVEANKQCSL
jgi:hypothetical protein